MEIGGNCFPLNCGVIGLCHRRQRFVWPFKIYSGVGFKNGFYSNSKYILSRSIKQAVSVYIGMQASVEHHKLKSWKLLELQEVA